MATASLLASTHDGVVDEPDPAARPRRRSFAAEYKAEILEGYDALPVGSSERGALLRREGLYSSHLAERRKARDAGARDALAPKAKANRSAEQVELERLRRRNERLSAELAKTRSALDVMGNCTRSYGLFVIIDIFSRYVVGWMVSPAETGELAEAFTADTLTTHRIDPGTLTLHADRARRYLETGRPSARRSRCRP